MAVSVGAVNNCSVFLSVAAPPFSVFRHRNFNSLVQYRNLRRRYSNFDDFSFSKCVLGVRRYSFLNLFESILEEFEDMRKFGRVRATKNKYSISASHYFPQGHIEQAEPDTDEVFAQVTLMPESNQDENAVMKDHVPPSSPHFDVHSFCKTLTASDTSTHGGFSVLRRHAEECLPPLDMTRQPPTQELVAKDLHGNEWRLRHIFHACVVLLDEKQSGTSPGQNNDSDEQKMMTAEDDACEKKAQTASSKQSIKLQVADGLLNTKSIKPDKKRGKKTTKASTMEDTDGDYDFKVDYFKKESARIYNTVV